MHLTRHATARPTDSGTFWNIIRYKIVAKFTCSYLQVPSGLCYNVWVTCMSLSPHLAWPRDRIPLLWVSPCQRHDVPHWTWCSNETIKIESGHSGGIYHRCLTLRLDIMEEAVILNRAQTIILKNRFRRHVEGWVLCGKQSVDRSEKSVNTRGLYYFH